MSDYTKTTNFTAKDNLSTGNALKVIKGSYFDTEFDAIAVATATKYDSNDIASQANAEGLSLNTVLMTPLATSYVVTQLAGAGLAEASGVLSFDINGLSADTPVMADTIAFEDVGGGADNKCTITALMTLLENNITLQEADISDLGTYLATGGSLAAATITTLQSTTINLGHASDTSLTRSAAGKVLVEGKGIMQHDGAHTSGDVTYSTSAASGGADGDLWFTYTA